MKSVKALLDGRIILNKVEIADSFFTRLMGLMYRKELEENTGLLLRPCSQIHTFGMKFAIDAVFLNKGGYVLSIMTKIEPHRILPYIPKSRQVLELNAGEAADIKIGNHIVFVN